MKLMIKENGTKRGKVIPRNAIKILAFNKSNPDGVEFVKDESGWKNINDGHYWDNGFMRRWFDEFEVIEINPEYQPKRTKEVHVLQGKYDLGWEDIAEYDPENYKEAKQDIKVYRENAPQYSYRIITRRVSV